MSELQASVEACSWDSAEEVLLKTPFVVLNALGQVLTTSNDDLFEGTDLNVYVFGREPVVRQLGVRRSSPLYDRDHVSIHEHSANEVFTIVPRSVHVGQDGCGWALHHVESLTAPVGTVHLIGLGENSASEAVVEYSFPVRHRYRVAVSFGGGLGRVDRASYQVVQLGTDRYELSESQQPFSPDFLLFLTAYPFDLQERNSGVGLGLTAGIPITRAVGENLFIGATVSVGIAGHLHVGWQFAKATRLAEGQRAFIGEEVPSTFTPATRSKWSGGLTAGLSVDATTALAAFGRGITKLLK